MNAPDQEAASLLALAAELEEHGARSQSAPAALRLAYAQIRRQAKQPDLFAADALAQARCAIEEDRERFQRLQDYEAARRRARFMRQQLRADRRRTYAAHCCGRFYTYSDASHTHWTHCFGCKQPLAYAPEFPTAAPRGLAEIGSTRSA